MSNEAQVVFDDVTRRITLDQPVDPRAEFAQRLDDVTRTENAFSDRVVRLLGQRGYKVVRQCRALANTASRHAQQLRAQLGVTQPG